MRIVQNLKLKTQNFGFNYLIKYLSFTFCILIFALGCSASASYISLNTTLTTKVENNQLRVLLESINKGDESAYNVQAEIRVGDKKFLAKKRQDLGINQRYKAYTTFKLGKIKPGQYPLVLIMHYTDANQYPFSALTCQTYSYKAANLPSDIFGRMKSRTFWKQGKVKLTLKNMSDSEISTSTFLVIPREITVAGGSQKATLLPKSQQTINFSVENFSALSGSNYQIFAIAEYEKEGRHQTSITPGMLKIVEAKQILGINYLYFMIIFAVLVAVFIAFQFGLPIFKK